MKDACSLHYRTMNTSRFMATDSIVGQPGSRQLAPAARRPGGYPLHLGPAQARHAVD